MLLGLKSVILFERKVTHYFLNSRMFNEKSDGRNEKNSGVKDCVPLLPKYSVSKKLPHYSKTRCPPSTVKRKRKLSASMGLMPR